MTWSRLYRGDFLPYILVHLLASYYLIGYKVSSTVDIETIEDVSEISPTVGEFNAVGPGGLGLIRICSYRQRPITSLGVLRLPDWYLLTS